MNDFIVIKIMFKNYVNTEKCFYIISNKKKVDYEIAHTISSIMFHKYS